MRKSGHPGYRRKSAFVQYLRPFGDRVGARTKSCAAPYLVEFCAISTEKTMTSLLKRLSVNLERRVTGQLDDMEPGSSRGVTASTSFNDFSMHIGQEGEDALVIGVPSGSESCQP